MPDNPSAPAAGQPASAAPQPAPAPQAPAIDPSEFTRLQSENARLARIEQQYKGVQPFYETAKKYGFEKPEHFDRLKPLTERGISLDKLGSAFANDDDGDTDEPQALTPQALEALLDKREQASKRRQAEEEHQKLLDEEWKALQDDNRYKAVLGDKADPKLTSFAKYAAMGRYVFEGRQPYPEGHPLHGDKQFGVGGAGKDFLAQVDSFIKDGLTAAQARKLADIATAAGEPTPRTTPAGATGDGGKPAKEERRPGGLPTKEQIEAQFKARQARRAAAAR